MPAISGVGVTSHGGSHASRVTGGQAPRGAPVPVAGVGHKVTHVGGRGMGGPTAKPQHRLGHAGGSGSECSEDLLELGQRYDLCKVIGEGTYGVVYKAVQKATGKEVALKKIRLDNPELLEEIGVPGTAIREIILLRELDHPNIVGLLEVTHVDLQLWLVFEYCHNDLKHHIKHHMRQRRELLAQQVGGSDPTGRATRGLPMETCKRFVYQLLAGLAYCHGRRILHRDLKPQNLLLDETGTVLKIADFGLARTFTPPSKPKTQEVVTLWYRAPELLLGDKCYGASVDLWSVGCIMAELVGGRPLFPGDSEIDTLFKIFRLIGTPTNENWPGVCSLSHFQNEFPKWRRDKKQSMKQLLFELDADGLDLLSKLLEFVPSSRITAATALHHPWLREPATAASKRCPESYIN